jgi:dihydroorotase
MTTTTTTAAPQAGGFCDLVASLRFPRAPDEESAIDLVKAAVAGGVSTVVVGVKGEAPVDNARFQAACAALRGAHGVTVIPAVCPVVDGGLADIASIERPAAWLAASSSSWLVPDVARFVYRLPHAIDDAVILRRVGEIARARHAVVIAPSVDAGLAAGAVAVEGAVATRLGLPAMPEAAEAIGITRLLAVARLTGARIHVAGVFTAEGAALLASSGNERVTGSVHASHLLLDETALLARRYDTRFLRRPPLPTPASREALLAAVKAGTLLVSTGHTHVPKRERDLEPTRATPGGTSLASAARLLRPLLGDDVLARAFGTGPARVLGDARSTPPAPPARSLSVDVDDDLHRCVQEFPR